MRGRLKIGPEFVIAAKIDGADGGRILKQANANLAEMSYGGRSGMAIWQLSEGRAFIEAPEEGKDFLIKCSKSQGR
jgi:hypothetical protein